MLPGRKPEAIQPAGKISGPPEAIQPAGKISGPPEAIQPAGKMIFLYKDPGKPEAMPTG